MRISHEKTPRIDSEVWRLVQQTALFSVVNGVLLRPLPFQEPKRLVTLFESNPARRIEQLAVSPPNFADWLAQSRAFEEMAFWTGPSDLNLVTQDGTEKVRASY